MDAREFIEVVKQAEEDGIDYFEFAAKIVELQKENDAKVAEALNQPTVAAAIRGSI